MQKNLVEEIAALKKKRNALILAHNYQVDEVQDIADFVGDSFALSQKAAETDHDVIVFCGVNFMAETAAILAPNKTVLLPDLAAGCPLADMITLEELEKAKMEHPQAAVVCYVNTSAEIKAACDICCTSANAVKVIDSLEADEVLFVPDGNLADWVSQNTSKKIIPWSGFCPTHHRITVDDIEQARLEHPGAPVALHPECHPDLVARADFVGSTSAILAFARKSDDQEFIIGTETGILHQLRRENPDKKFYLLSPMLVCPNMKLITLEKVYEVLRDMKNIITVPEEIGSKARRALERMLAVK